MFYLRQGLFLWSPESPVDKLGKAYHLMQICVAWTLRRSFKRSVFLKLLFDGLLFHSSTSPVIYYLLATWNELQSPPLEAQTVERHYKVFERLWNSESEKCVLHEQKFTQMMNLVLIKASGKAYTCLRERSRKGQVTGGKNAAFFSRPRERPESKTGTFTLALNEVRATME